METEYRQGLFMLISAFSFLGVFLYFVLNFLKIFCKKIFVSILLTFCDRGLSITFRYQVRDSCTATGRIPLW